MQFQDVDGPDESVSSAEPDSETESTALSPIVPTGHDEVDAVLAELDSLSDRPVTEHVGVFERAHETLRRTLNGAGGQD